MSATPEGRVAAAGVAARGVWHARALVDVVTLFVEDRELVVRLGDGEELVLPLRELTGAEWRGEVLTVYAGEDQLQLAGAAQLDRLWVVIAARACAVPEMTRGLRALGGRHGADDELQLKFFIPLLEARRRLESAEPIDWKVGGVDASALEERTRALLGAMASERYPDRPPYRRALEAELFDAAEPMFERLAQLRDVASEFHRAPEATRFIAWRAWAFALRMLFIDADRTWIAIRRTLANVPIATMR